MSYVVTQRRKVGADSNKLYPEDIPVHEWYRFVLSYPPHLVRDYIKRFGITKDQLVLDPFCGTGTTNVECKKLGIPSVGIEANLVAHFAGHVKINWNPDPDGLIKHASAVAESVLSALRTVGIEDDLFFTSNAGSLAYLRTLPPEVMKLMLTNSISPLPLHKVLVLIDQLKSRSDERYYHHEMLALAKALVCTISNLKFGPEVGIGRIKDDVSVIRTWLAGVQIMADDLRNVNHLRDVPAYIHCADARQPLQVIEANSIDAVITSPPYPNEKDYTRTTRLESVLLGFITDKQGLRKLKKELVRSNTRGVYKEDTDDQWIAEHPAIIRLADEIETRRIELGKTSGFERLYARVTRLYFGGMKRHLTEMRKVLRPGAQLAYVVGDQASYFRVMIRTGQLLAEIAESLGYELIGIDLFRTRISTATREQLREEVVLLRWPGPLGS